MTISIPFFFLFLLAFSGFVTTGGTSFDFQTFKLTSLKLLGDAHLFQSSVRLTRDLLVPNTGAGMVLYNEPVRFRCPKNETPASFSSFFSFTISNLNPDSIGGGMAFVISPNDEVLGNAGGYLGIPTGAVAIEFDTLMDDEFKDVNLRSGNLVNAWVEYSGESQQLNISISHRKPKPKSPVLSISINLNQHVNEFMFVGFTGSTQGSTEIHSVEWWSFTSCFAEQQQPPPPPPTKPPTKTTLDSPLSENSNASKPPKKTKGCKQCAGWVFGILGVFVAGAASWYIGIEKVKCFTINIKNYYYSQTK